MVIRESWGQIKNALGTPQNAKNLKGYSTGPKKIIKTTHSTSVSRNFFLVCVKN